MVWPLRNTNATATTPDWTRGLTLQDKLQRVSSEDIAAVTQEDVEQLKRTMTHDMLRTAMETMLEENKFVDVLAHSSPKAWEAASRDVQATEAQIFTSLIKERMVLLFNVLPYLSEDFLTVMESSLSPF